MFYLLCVMLISLNVYPSLNAPKPPEIPDRFDAILINPISGEKRAQIMKWVNEKPINKNAVLGNESLLQIVLKNQKARLPGFDVLAQELLDTKPYIGYKYQKTFLAEDVPQLSELQDLCMVNRPISKEHEVLQIKFAQQIIDLMIEQGTTYQAIEKQLAEIAPQHPKVKEEAVTYVRDLYDERASKIAEEELKKHLLPELAPIAAEYVAPQKKNNATKATSDKGK
jgi:hypothetical protein